MGGMQTEKREEKKEAVKRKIWVAEGCFLSAHAFSNSTQVEALESLMMELYHEVKRNPGEGQRDSIPLLYILVPEAFCLCP